jgi:excisionase family DNA binding protein
METHYIKVIEVAQYLGIGRSQAYDLVKRGVIPSVRIGSRTLRVSLDELEKWVAEKGVQQKMNF